MNINDLRVIDGATGEPRPLDGAEMESVLATGNGQVNEQSIQLMAALVIWLADSGYGTSYVTHRPPPIPLRTLARAYASIDSRKTPDEWMSEIERFTVAAIPGLAEKIALRDAQREFGPDYE